MSDEPVDEASPQLTQLGLSMTWRRSSFSA